LSKKIDVVFGVTKMEKMGALPAKTKSPTAAILRRRRAAVAAFRRDRRIDDEARSIPDTGRIVFRAGGTTTLR